MSRTIAVAVFAVTMSAASIAAPQNQLIAPNLNPGLRTVPSVPHTYYAGEMGDCATQLVTRIDSGTVIKGPDGQVAHMTGMATGATSAAGDLVITSVSADGLSATADFMACMSESSVTPGPVSAIMPLTGKRESVTVRAQSNQIVLQTAKQ